MRIRFSDDHLRRLYVEKDFIDPRVGRDITRQFRKKVGFLQSAADLRDLYGYTALHLEKLGGDRRGQHSIRLNKQWRLILELEEDADGHLVIIISITDYH